MDAKGIIIIISGPSGAGEDSIIEGLSHRMPIERIVTTTTRAPRAGESEGNPYYFISKDEFEQGIAADMFFEYANHYNGNYYGVTFAEIERVRAADAVGIWKIDYKGVETVKRLMSRVKAIYIGAPLDVLEARIRSRDGVEESYVEERMAYTREWVTRMDLYDYAIENEQGKLEESIDQAERIIERIITIQHGIDSGVPVRVGAGGVIISKEHLIAIVANREANRDISGWTLPKGGVDEGETIDEGAIREIEEETGLTNLTKIEELESYYRLGGVSNDVLKKIHMILYRTDEENLAPTDPHNPEARWVTLEEATQMMIHQEDRFFLERIRKRLLEEGVRE